MWKHMTCAVSVIQQRHQCGVFSKTHPGLYFQYVMYNNYSPQVTERVFICFTRYDILVNQIVYIFGLFDGFFVSTLWGIRWI